MRRFLIALAGVLLAAVHAPIASAESVLKVVMHSDLKEFDPIWSGSYIVRNFGYMIYDTLFAMDENFQVKPQMVDTWKTSEDGKTWTFTLREGLQWHDGTPVTSADCIASLKRWAARDSIGQKLAPKIKEYRPVDARTFEIVLSDKFPPLLDAIGKPSVVVPFMMPKQVAETDPFKQISTSIGSGPFIFKRDEWKPGERLVFVKNPKYVPRSEPPSGLAGGKVATLDRVEWVWIPDPQTAVNALLNGEIDMIENVTHDHLPVLEGAKGIQILRPKASNQYGFRLNWLNPPFNNQKARQAVAYALSQDEFLQAGVGDKRFYRPCKAMFTCDSPLASTAGMDGLVEGNAEKAKQLLAEAKYDGTPIVLLQPTDLDILKPMPLVAKKQLEKAGFKVDVQSMDWQSMVARLLSKKGPPSEGGWSAFGTSWSQIDILDPLMTPWLAATCDKARAGWPCDSVLEKMRDVFVLADTPQERKAEADAIQTYAMQIVTHVPLGEWWGVAAARDTLVFPKVLAPVTVFWNVGKK